MRKLTLLVCLLTPPATARAAVLHVPADYGTIGAAIAAANPGDEVLVAAGTYYERFSLDASKDGVKIHSESGPAVTIIDSGYGGSVVIMTAVGSGTELIGFTIAHGGHAPATSTDFGGAIRLDEASPIIDHCVITHTSSQFGSIYSSGGTPTITACVFDANSAQNGGGICLGGPGVIKGDTFTNNDAPNGGGIYVGTGASADVEDCVFRGNSSSVAGGVYSAGSTITLVNNQVIANTAQAGGAAIYVAFATSATIHGNWIQDNDCPHGSGGGIYLDRVSFASIEQNVILRNHAVAWGGGITVWESTATLTGNTLALNRGDLGGGNIHFRRFSSVTMQKNISSHSPDDGVDNDTADGPNTASLSCNDVSKNAGGNYLGMTDPTGTNGNISADPQYCSLAMLDVHLSAGSPCAAGNSPPGCNLTGALDVNCDGPVRTEVTTWGRMKARYR